MAKAPRAEMLRSHNLITGAELTALQARIIAALPANRIADDMDDWATAAVAARLWPHGSQSSSTSCRASVRRAPPRSGRNCATPAKMRSR